MRILILNGPNLNLLGQRETEIYGTQNLGDLENQLRKFGQGLGADIECYQSNHEGHLIDALHRARNRVQGVVFNPGGYCHTSVALRDAIAAIKIPVIEVHISNIHGREEFRSHSLTAGVCAGQICGMGFLGYELAVQAVLRILHAAPAVVAEPARPAERAEDSRREDHRREELRREESRREDLRREDKAREDKVRDDKARDEKAREDKAREEREEREGKRRRRGRRGGRGRRRGEQEEGAPREEREGAESAEHDQGDIAERYANLKGVVVRRGLDVLAEIGEEGEEEMPPPHAKALVTFRDAPEEMQAYTAAPNEDSEPALEVIPSKPAPAPERHRHNAPAPAPAPEPQPEAAHAAEPVEETAPAEVPEEEAQPLESTEPGGQAPAGEEENGEQPLNGETAAPEDEEAAKGSRGGRRRKSTAGGRRRAPRKKTEE